MTQAQFDNFSQTTLIDPKLSNLGALTISMVTSYLGGDEIVDSAGLLSLEAPLEIVDRQ